MFGSQHIENILIYLFIYFLFNHITWVRHKLCIILLALIFKVASLTMCDHSLVGHSFLWYPWLLFGFLPLDLRGTMLHVYCKWHCGFIFSCKIMGT